MKAKQPKKLNTKSGKKLDQAVLKNIMDDLFNDDQPQTTDLDVQLLEIEKMNVKYRKNRDPKLKEFEANVKKYEKENIVDQMFDYIVEQEPIQIQPLALNVDKQMLNDIENGFIEIGANIQHPDFSSSMSSGFGDDQDFRVQNPFSDANKLKASDQAQELEPKNAGLFQMKNPFDLDDQQILDSKMTSQQLSSGDKEDFVFPDSTQKLTKMKNPFDDDLIDDQFSNGKKDQIDDMFENLLNAGKQKEKNEQLSTSLQKPFADVEGFMSFSSTTDLINELLPELPIKDS